MVQPTPPGDMPLIEGLGPEWNDVVSYIPEDKRGEFTPKFKERIGAFESQYAPLKQWEDLQKSGITPDHASTALKVYSAIENDPKQVYEAIGKHLGITPQQAKEVVEEVQEGDQEDPRIVRMQQQLDTLAQIALAKNNMETQQRQAEEADKAIEAEISEVKKKYGDFPDDEVLMRMLHKNMSAEEAYQEYASRVDSIRSRRPAPFLLGSGGHVPSSAIDVRKLDSAGTKAVVAQMLEHGNQASK